MYRPLPNNLTIKNSQIDGLGLFSTEFILSGTDLLYYLSTMSEIQDLIKEIKKIKRGKTVCTFKTIQCVERALESELTTEMDNDIDKYGNTIGK